MVEQFGLPACEQACFEVLGYPLSWIHRVDESVAVLDFLEKQ